MKMSARKRRKYIYGLKRQDGTMTWNNRDKEDIIHDYFSKLMGRKVPRSKTLNWERLALANVQEELGIELDWPFTEREIECAVHSLPSGKAPGPNGFTSEFYKHYWDIIKLDVVSTFHGIHILQCDSLSQVNGGAGYYDTED
jgi:hypothetical protein